MASKVFLNLTSRNNVSRAFISGGCIVGVKYILGDKCLLKEIPIVSKGLNIMV